MKRTPLPWTFDHDPVQQATYGNDWPLTANVRGISLDGDGDYKPCFARVKFGGSVPIEDQRAAMSKILTAVNAHDELLAALRQIVATASRFTMPIPEVDLADVLDVAQIHYRNNPLPPKGSNWPCDGIEVHLIRATERHHGIRPHGDGALKDAIEAARAAIARAEGRQ